MSQKKFALDTSNFKPEEGDAPLINTTEGEFKLKDISITWVYKLIQQITEREQVGDQKDIVDGIDLILKETLDGITKAQIAAMSPYEKDALFIGIQSMVGNRAKSISHVGEMVKTDARG